LLVGVLAVKGFPWCPRLPLSLRKNLDTV